jgi:hypothetical protein
MSVTADDGNCATDPLTHRSRWKASPAGIVAASAFAPGAEKEKRL